MRRCDSEKHNVHREPRNATAAAFFVAGLLSSAAVVPILPCGKNVRKQFTIALQFCAAAVFGKTSVIAVDVAINGSVAAFGNIVVSVAVVRSRKMHSQAAVVASAVAA